MDKSTVYLNKRIITSIIKHILLIFGAVVMLLPFYWMVVSSIKPASEILKIPPTWWPTKVTFEHYKKVLVEYYASNKFNIYRYYFNSVLVCTIITAITMFTSSIVGFVLGKYKFPGVNLIFLGIVATMMIPFEVRMLPLYNLALNLKMNDTYFGLIFPSLFSTFGIFLLRQHMHSIPDDLLDSATIDGCSEFTKYFRIVFPLCKQVLGALAIFTFMWNWDQFVWPLLVTNERAMYTLQLALAGLINERAIPYGIFMSCATLSSVIIIIVFLIFKNSIVEGIALTGLKS